MSRLRDLARRLLTSPPTHDGEHTIEIHVTLNDAVSNAYYMTGKVTVDGKLAARLDFACAVAQPE